MYFVEYDALVSKMTLYLLQQEGMEGIFRKEGVDTEAYLGKKGWILGHILGEITDLEFGTHSFLMNHVFLPTEQVETNIC